MFSTILIGSFLIFLGIAMHYLIALDGDILYANIFLVFFCFAGVYVIISSVIKIVKKHYILSNGRRFKAKIIDYQDDNSIKINGIPALDLVVTYDAGDDIERVLVVPTHEHSNVSYPIGSTGDIYILGDEVAMDKDSIRR